MLAPVTALSEQIELDVSSVRERSTAPGSVRSYANGRQRSVSSAGVLRTLDVELELLDDRPTLAALRSWQGRTVLYRDARGRRVFGAFFDLSVDESVVADLAAVSLTLTEVSYVEAV